MRIPALQHSARRSPEHDVTTLATRAALRLGHCRYSPNTNSMVWFRCLRSSGVCECRRLEIGLKPDRIATYCFPLTSKVIGGALKPVPTLIFHSCCMVVSS